MARPFKAYPNYQYFLNERQKLVLDTMRMNYTAKQGLAYLKNFGFEISERAYNKDKQRIRESSLSRVYFIAKEGFTQQHIERIDNIETALKEMWIRYTEERDNFKKVLILEKIIMSQPLLASFYEATKKVIEENPDLRNNIDKLRQEIEANPEVKKIYQERNGQLIELENQTNINNSTDNIDNKDELENKPEENGDLSNDPELSEFDKVTKRFNKAKRDFIL